MIRSCATGKGAFLRHARSSSLRVSIAGHACGVRSMSSLLAPRSTQSSHCLRTSHPSRPSVASTSITHQRRSLFIATASTPNPKSLKFTPTGKTLLDEGQTENFGDWDSAKRSPLARKLFLVKGVRVVFFAADYVSITIDDEDKWPLLKPSIFAAIMDFFDSGEPLMLPVSESTSSSSDDGADDSETVAMIKELIDARIRPAVQDDGGDIIYKSFDEETGIVRLQMQGACVGCPSSTVTLKAGIENMLKHYIPEVKSVEEISSPQAEVSEQQFEKLEEKLAAKAKVDTA